MRPAAAGRKFATSGFGKSLDNLFYAVLHCYYHTKGV